MPSEINDEYLSRAKEIAEHEIARRSLVRIPLYFLLYLACIYATPIAKRFPAPVFSFGGAVVLLSIARFYLASQWSQTSQIGVLRRLMTIGIYLTAMSWGLFCALTVQYFELGWVSFFVMLVTVGIAAGEMAALTPSFSILSSYMYLILGPTCIACFFFVKGLSGFAIGSFFLCYLVFLVLQGRQQSMEYWKGLRENSQLMAMIDAVPGTMSWISSDLVYLGVNRRMAELWDTKQEEFVGKKIGFLDASATHHSFVKNMFDSLEDDHSLETIVHVKGQPRNYFLFGQKYNLGAEAIILGLDITQMRESEKTALLERAQRFFSARMANLGQVTQIVYSGIREDLGRLTLDMEKKSSAELQADLLRIAGHLDIIQKISQKVKSGSGQKTLASISLAGLLGQIHGLFESFASKHEIKFVLKIDPAAEKARAAIPEGQLASVVISLLSNAFDAVVGAKTHEVRMELSVTPSGKISLVVSDTGPGVPDDVRPRLFEPLFTTKDADQATGIGLSVSKEIVESYGGSLSLMEGKQARFLILMAPSSGD